MLSHHDTSDAEFFSLVHHVLESSNSIATERRGDNRHDFVSEQFVAPYVGGRLPEKGDFRRVRFQDLSPGGFSFFERQPLKCEFLVVALGDAPFIFISAQIVRHRVTEFAGEAGYLVGCRFVARIKGVDYGHQLGVG